MPEVLSPSTEEDFPEVPARKNILLRIPLKLRWTIALTLGGIAGYDAYCANQKPTIHLNKGISVPKIAMESDLAKQIPSGDTPLEQIFYNVRSSRQMQYFIDHQTKPVGTLVNFADKFRESPEESQVDNWRGTCSTKAELVARWCKSQSPQAHPYLISIYPKGLTRKLTKDWHQFTVFRKTNGNILIFDKGLTEWRGTVEEYLESHYPTYSITPVGGVIEWDKAPAGFVEKFYDHFKLNEKIDKETVMPGEDKKLQPSA